MNIETGEIRMLEAAGILQKDEREIPKEFNDEVRKFFDEKEEKKEKKIVDLKGSSMLSQWAKEVKKYELENNGKKINRAESRRRARKVLRNVR